jgi:hypothetical protein
MYLIFIKSNNNPRTINTPMMARTNYDCIRVNGRANLETEVSRLRAEGQHISEVRTALGGWVNI